MWLKIDLSETDLGDCTILYFLKDKIQSAMNKHMLALKA